MRSPLGFGGLNHRGLGLLLDESGGRYRHSGGNAGFGCHVLAYGNTWKGAVVMATAARGCGSYDVLRRRRLRVGMVRVPR